MSTFLNSNKEGVDTSQCKPKTLYPRGNLKENFIAGVLLSVLCVVSVLSSLDVVVTSQLLLQFILTHTSVSLAVQVRLTSHVHDGVKQQSHC